MDTVSSNITETANSDITSNLDGSNNDTNPKNKKISNKRKKKIIFIAAAAIVLAFVVGFICMLLVEQ